MSGPNLAETLRPLVDQLAPLIADRLQQMQMQPAPPDCLFLTSKEAAERARCCITTIQRWTRSGRLPSHRVGRRLRILVSDLDALLGGAKP